MLGKSRRLLILDFDGVICDSAVECMLTAWNAYQAVQDSPDAKAYTLEQLDRRQAEMFLRHRYLVRVAREYFLLWRAIEAGIDLDQVTELETDETLGEEVLRPYHEAFYRERIAWRQEDRAGWNAANPLFRGIEPLFRCIEDGSAAILSAKDKPSIRAILGFYGLNTDRTGIFGSDSGLDKPELLERIREQYTVPYTRMVCLDDNLQNLLRLTDAGVHGGLAAWGYNSECERSRARDSGLDLVEVDRLAEWVDGFA